MSSTEEEVKIETTRKQVAATTTKKKQTPPQMSASPNVTEIERYPEVYNPQSVYTEHNKLPKDRAKVLEESGMLKSITNFDIQKELEHLQSERARFVAWQANQQDFIMQKFVMYNSETGLDRWDPVSYSFYPLTVGQWKAIQLQEAKEKDLIRSLDDKSIKDANTQLVLASIETLKMKCGLFFRMNIDDKSEGYEFEYIHWPDLRDCVEAASYKINFPSSNKRPRYEAGIS